MYLRPFHHAVLRGLTLALALASLAPVAAVSADIETIRVATTANDSGAQVFFAQKLGLFEKAGLHVDITALMNGGIIGSGVAAGTYDIAAASTISVVAGYQSGLAFTFIAPAAVYSNTNATNLLLVAKNGPIHDAADLSGKTIAVAGLLNLAQVAVAAWIDKHGGDSSKVRFIEMPYSLMGPSIKAGRIEAASISEPFLRPAMNGETRSIGAPFDAVAPNFLLGGWFTRTSYVKEHPDAVRKFRDAIAEASRWANTHQAESAKIVEEALKSPVPADATRARFADRLTAALLQPLIDASYKYHALKAATPAADVMYIAPES